MKGRPRQTADDCMRNRIIATLQKEVHLTATLIAAKMDANVHTVSSQLRRMLKEGVVAKQGRGLYELFIVQDATPQPKTKLQPDFVRRVPVRGPLVEPPKPQPSNPAWDSMI